MGPAQRQRGAHQPRDAAQRDPSPSRSLGDLPHAASVRRGGRAPRAARIFGSHVAHVLRRLRRLCAVYGSSPTFVFTSATIGSPQQLAGDLCGLDVCAVLDDGSPRGERLVALWNPPRLERTPLEGDDDVPGPGRRRSTNREAAGLTAELVESGHHTICFCRSRKGTELVAGEAPATARPPRRHHPLLPRRLPPHGAARDRGRAVLRPAARRGGDHCAGARNRRRRAGRLRPGRLPRNGRVHVAAGGAGRPRRPAVPGRAGGGRGPARPVDGRPPHRAVHPGPRAGGGEPGQPLCAPPPSGGGCFRASDHT